MCIKTKPVSIRLKKKKSDQLQAKCLSAVSEIS